MDVDEYQVKNHRYTIFIDENPNKVLEPIWGYAAQPLVSLREACKPLYKIVSRLEPHIWVALENSKNPLDNLTQDESAAIQLYTMEWKPLQGEPKGSLYVHLNRTLRGTNRSQLQPWFLYLKLLLTALAKIPISSRQIIWRGIRIDQSNDYVPGTEVTWWSFTSCTTSLSVLETDVYLGKAGTRTLFSIEALNGRTIRNHSRFRTEDEILLLPGTRLVVLSRLNPAPDLHIIHLRQIRPPYQLLEPPFDGANLLPPSTDSEGTMGFDEDIKHDMRLWYKKKKVWFISGIAIILIILAIILGAVLGSRKSTSGPPVFIFNQSANVTFLWCGSTWSVRNERNSQPGAKNWAANNVVFDPVTQYVYMNITRDSFGNWWCAQMKSQNLYSFGNFTFFVNASIDRFDPNVELRMYTEGGDDETNGISIDIGRLGQVASSAPDLWYTVYPNTINGSIITNSSLIPKLDGTYTTHRFNWWTDIVIFQAEYDHNWVSDIYRQFYSYSTPVSWTEFVPQVPAPVIISLCTYNGSAPLNNQNVEVNMQVFNWLQN